MTDMALKCRCGEVRGIALNVGSDTGTRAVCYCDDCQAFARYLDKADEVLDDCGGTEVFQLPPARVRITEGREQIRCVRLTPKGTYRWYTGCCGTPIGNTLSAGWSFLGMIHNFIDDAVDRDAVLGPVRGYVYVKYASKSLPEERRKTGDSPRLILRAMLKVAGWKLKGLNRPSPFFDADGKPIVEPLVANA